MRIRLVLALTFLVLGLSEQTHAQTYDWAQRLPGSSTNYVTSVAADNKGNVAVAGYFRDSLILGTTILKSAGKFDAFIARYDAAGTLLWARAAGGPADDYAYGVATDSSGNIYATGQYFGAASFDTTTLVGTQFDVWAAKLDANGNWLWARKAGGSGTDVGRFIATDKLGNAYVSGYFQFTAGFGQSFLTSGGNTNYFLAKLTSDGTFEWSSRIQPFDSVYVGGIAVGPDQNPYVGGGFENSIAFGSTTLTSKGGFDAFVARYSRISGEPEWGASVGGEDYDYGYGIGLDARNNIYLSGYFKGTSLFGSNTVNSKGSYDYFVTKIANGGGVEWVRTGGGTSIEASKSLAVDAAGNSYVLAYFDGVMTIDSAQLTTHGSVDVAVSKYNTFGKLIWAVNTGGENFDYSNGITTDGVGHTWIGGYFINQTKIGPSVLQAESVASQVAFTAKMTEPTILTTSPGTITFCGGESILVNFKASGIYGIGNEFLAELSDSAGTFRTPRVIGRVTARKDSLEIPSVIPSTIAAGSKYRIRVSSSRPIVYGLEYGPYFTIAPRPTASIEFHQPILPCDGDTLRLTAHGASRYHWNTGDTTQSILVRHAGTYTVTASMLDGASCDTMISQTVDYAVIPHPTITRSGDTLQTEPGQLGYQWYLNDSLIPGTGSTLIVTRSGRYAVEAMNGHCTGRSADLTVTLNQKSVARSANSPARISTYPSPVNSQLHITGTIPADEHGEKGINARMELYSLLGLKLATIFEGEITRALDLTYPTSQLPAGTYFLRTETSGGVVTTERIIVRH